MKHILTYRYYILICLLSIIAILPLFHAGFFYTHDDTQVARVYEMGKMLKEGVFPVRFVPDLGYGYGYPLFNFYAPLAYYIGGGFMLLGQDALGATKLLFLLPLILSGMSMYTLAKEFWGEQGGLISGILYVYAPFHALNTYVRGDVAELFAYALIPFLLWGIGKVYETSLWKYVIVTSVAYALLILSHTLSTMMISPFFFLACGSLYIIKRRRKQSYDLFLLLLVPLLGILLSTFYWLPVLTEIKYTNALAQIGGNADFQTQFVCLSQLWSGSWMYGWSIPGCADGMSFQIGTGHIVLSGIALLLSLFSFKKYKKQGIVVLISVAVFLLGVYLMLSISRPLWEVIPPMVFFQYPWKFLLLTSLASSFLGGGVIWYVQKYKHLKHIILLGIILVVSILLWTSMKIFVPQKYLNKTSADYTSEKALKEYASSLSDEFLPPRFVKPSPNIFFKERYVIRKGTTKITTVSEHPLIYNLTVASATPSELLIKLAYFPTWHIYINGTMHEFGYSSRGLIVTLQKGTYNISVRFRQTPIEVFSNSISIVTVVTLMFFTLYTRLKKSHKRKGIKNFRLTENLYETLF